LYQVADSLFGRDITTGINANVNSAAIISNTTYSQLNLCDYIFMNDTTTVTSLNEILGAARTCSVIGTTNPNQVIVQVTMSETANYKPFM